MDLFTIWRNWFLSNEDSNILQQILVKHWLIQSLRGKILSKKCEVKIFVSFYKKVTWNIWKTSFFINLLAPLQQSSKSKNETLHSWYRILFPSFLLAFALKAIRFAAAVSRSFSLLVLLTIPHCTKNKVFQ